MVLCGLAGASHAQSSVIGLGHALFRSRCAICHGETGTGDGPAARFLRPKPADLTRGQLKSSTGETSFSEALRTSIRNGRPRTSMPRFAALRQVDLEALTAFISSISGRPPDDVGADRSPARNLYEAMGCGSCHGPDGRGDGPASKKLVDDQGEPIAATDFRYPGAFRLGHRPEDVARVIRSGVAGTPMPAYAGVLDEAAARELAGYVLQFGELNAQ